MNVSEIVARPVRTALQLGLVAGAVEFVDSAVYDMSDRTYTASIALGTILLSLIQASVENKTGKALLRQVPPRDVPVVEDAA